MNEEEKEAIEITKTLIEFAGDAYIPKRNREKLQTILNLIQKQNKIINKMAEMLVKVPENIDEPEKLSLAHFLNEHLEEKKQRVIDYILNLVEKESK